MNQDTHMRLENKVAIVTGAAFGMGESTALIFTREGAKVVVADIAEEAARKVVAQITADGGDAVFVRLDVSKEAEWAAAMRATVDRYGRLDILVNNAGVSGALPDLNSLADFDRLMAINARGTFLGMQSAMPEMRKAGGGSIVNLSSISGIIGQTNVHMGYNGAKAAIHVMTKAAAVQFAKDNIRVNSVHPGMMPPMRSGQAGADPSARARALDAVPLKRAGRPEEAAYAVLFLASDEASYITGTEIIVDGGYLAL
jgi:NAD(P)-dependent dehydrogenase (short-subunit alcohol dehydrogenase family)